MGVNKRLRELEDKVLGKPEIGSTRFCTADLPEAEQILLENARKIAVAHIPYEEVTEAQKTILNEASKLLNFRIFDLFTSHLENLLCHGDKIARITLHERFLWFIGELAKDVQQQLDVSEIQRNTPEDCEVDRVDEYFQKAPELYTAESFDEIESELMRDMLKKNPNLLTELSKKGET